MVRGTNLMFDARPNLASTSGALGHLSSKGPVFQQPPQNKPSPWNVGSVLKNNLTMERFNEFRHQKFGNVRPWVGEFFNREQFTAPEGYSMVQNRLFNNIGYFQSNYLLIMLILLVYCMYPEVAIMGADM